MKRIKYSGIPYSLATLLLLSQFAYASSTVDVCQKAKQTLNQPKSDLIQIVEYKLPPQVKTITITVYTSTDCKKFTKKFSNPDPDIIACRNGHFMSTLPASETPPGVQCIKLTSCFKQNCFTNITQLVYRPNQTKPYKAIPSYRFLNFTTTTNQPITKTTNSKTDKVNTWMEGQTK